MYAPGGAGGMYLRVAHVGGGSKSLKGSHCGAYGVLVEAVIKDIQCL